MAIGHKLGLRLFLEGIEVPCIGASISAAPNSPAVASIQVIATNEIFNILPRTVVHLFFYDFVENDVQVNLGAKNSKGVSWVEPDPPVRKRNQPPPPTEEEVNKSDEEKLYEQYKLLFMGEVQGLQFAKDAGNRSVVLSCVDFSNYWDTTYQYNFNGQLIGGRREAAFIGANANLFTSPLGHGEGTISALLKGRPASFPKLQGLLGGIIHVLEAIGGCYYADKAFKGANPFCSIAELRLKLLQQICAAEADTSTTKLFSEKTFAAWMNRSIGGLGKLVTFRGLVQMMERFIYHEVYPVPSPMFVPEETLQKQKTVAVNILDDPTSIVFAGELGVLFKDARKLLRQLDAYIAYSKLLAGDSTVALPGNVTPANPEAEMAGLLDEIHASIKTIVRDYDTVKKIKPPSKFQGVAAKVQVIGKWVDDLGSIESMFTNRTKVTSKRARDDASKIVDLCDEILGKTRKYTKTKVTNKVARVNNQIFRPDVWYAPPPRCNVIFPELYSNIQWSRNFMREVSRLELQSTNAILGDNALFNSRYYSPNVADMRKGAKLSDRAFSALIMEHELYTGIIPMYEKMTELNLFGMQQTGNDKILALKVGYGQRAANHQYFKHRFASRQMQCSGRFNPWAVPGFPMLIIDRPMNADELQRASQEVSTVSDLQYVVAPQFVGTLVQLSHNVSQQGGQTSYAFAQARVHRESSEYLGVDNVFVSKVIGSSIRKTTIFCLPESVPKEGTVGPLGGTIEKVEEVTSLQIGKTKKVYPGNKTSQKLKWPTMREIDTNSGLRAYRITEKIARRQKQTATNIPIEDAIRPPWIWSGWHNKKIGKTYQEMIGTDSIVNVEEVTGIEVGSPKEEVDQEPDAIEPDPQGTLEVILGHDKPSEIKPIVDTPVVKRVVTDPTQTVEASTDALVRIYSTVREQGMDIGNFIRLYTWRPIANMVDILGSPDLSYKETSDGHVVVATGTEGFHSRAFGDKADLFGLANTKVRSVLGLSEEKNAATLAKLDVRASRREVVRRYVYELHNSRGLLG